MVAFVTGPNSILSLDGVWRTKILLDIPISQAALLIEQRHQSASTVGAVFNMSADFCSHANMPRRGTCIVCPVISPSFLDLSQI